MDSKQVKGRSAPCAGKASRGESELEDVFSSQTVFGGLLCPQLTRTCSASLARLESVTILLTWI